jgi:acetyl-CoA C-acetyltransferase
MATQFREVIIAGACRTPIGAFQGALASVSAPALGALVVKAAVLRAGIDPVKVDEVIMGCVLPAGAGQAPARQAALKAGLPAGVTCRPSTKSAAPASKLHVSGVRLRSAMPTLLRRHGEHD